MKLKAHYYIARLLFVDIKAVAGSINIRGFDAKMSDDLCLAIVENEQAFLAGALGPDIYPDMLVGELRIHPQKDINSGLWLAMMFEEFRNNYDYRTPEGKEVLSFIAGWMVHYTSDVFMRTLINHTLGEKSYTDSKNPPSSPEEKALFRAVETYLEKKVTENRLLKNAKVKVPVDFLKRFFIDDRRICFNSAKYRSKFYIKKVDQADANKESKDATDNKATSNNEVSKDNVIPDDIAMLDFMPENLDLLFLLGGTRRMFLLDENAPLEEQEQIEDNDKDKKKSNYIPFLKKADKLIEAWMSMIEALTDEILSAKIEDKDACDSALNRFKEQLAVLEKELIQLLEVCRAIITQDGIPHWLLELLMRKNYLDMSELAGKLPANLGPLKGEISIKITGPSSPVVKQVNKLISNMVEEGVPEMVKNIHKRISSILPTDAPESSLESKWDKEKLDKNLGNFGKDAYSVAWQNGVPVADALNLAKLCLITTESFNKIAKTIFANSPWYVKYDFDKENKGTLGIVGETTFPKVTKRLRFKVRVGNPESLESCSITLADDEVITVEKQHSFSIYMLFEQFRNYTDIKSVMLKVKTGLLPEDSFVIAVEAENLRIKERWKELIYVEGTLKTVSDCKVVYNDNLDDIEHSPPEVEDDDGVSQITIPLTIKKKEEGEEKGKAEGIKNKKQTGEFPGLDFDIGVLSFVKSLEAGKEWMSLENDNPLYYYFLHKLMHLSEECYR